MIHGLADQTVLLMCDKAAAEGIDDICRAADRRACTADHSAAIGLAPRQRGNLRPAGPPHVFLPRFRPLYRWGGHALNDNQISEAACTRGEGPQSLKAHEYFTEIYSEGARADG